MGLIQLDGAFRQWYALFVLQHKAVVALTSLHIHNLTMASITATGVWVVTGFRASTHLGYVFGVGRAFDFCAGKKEEKHSDITD